jgi:hypothetical protein
MRHGASYPRLYFTEEDFGKRQNMRLQMGHKKAWPRRTCTPIAVRVHVRIMRTLPFLGVYGVYMRHGRMPNVRCTGVHRKFAVYAVFGIQKRT